MIAFVAAIDEKNGLSSNGDLLVKLPVDLKRFKRLTSHATVLMGRKTYKSIGHALPDRQNIILTRQTDFNAPDCVCVNTVEKALGACDSEQLFIIGGGEIYRLCLPLCETLYLTHIHHTFDQADTFFPDINFEEWDCVFKEDHPADAQHPYAFSFVDYQRKLRKP